MCVDYLGVSTFLEYLLWFDICILCPSSFLNIASFVIKRRLYHHLQAVTTFYSSVKFCKWQFWLNNTVECSVATIISSCEEVSVTSSDSLLFPSWTTSTHIPLTYWNSTHVQSNNTVRRSALRVKSYPFCMPDLNTGDFLHFTAYYMEAPKKKKLSFCRTNISLTLPSPMIIDDIVKVMIEQTYRKRKTDIFCTILQIAWTVHSGYIHLLKVDATLSKTNNYEGKKS